MQSSCIAASNLSLSSSEISGQIPLWAQHPFELVQERWRGVVCGVVVCPDQKWTESGPRVDREGSLPLALPQFVFEQVDVVSADGADRGLECLHLLFKRT